MSKRGLPNNFKLRHDVHYVEQLTNRLGGAPIGRTIPIDKLAPNPNQPRAELGDLTELAESIAEKGILEPLLVRPSDVGGRFMIIAGERRYRAGLQVGLTELPCIELDVDDREVAEICLIENLQRKDLNPFEEADGLQALADRFGYTHEEIAKKIGKSRSSITETLSLATMPPEVRDQCRHADITAKSMLLQVVRQPSVREMSALVDRIKAGGLTRADARRVRKGKANGAKDSAFRYEPAGRGYSVLLRFRKANVGKGEIEQAMKDALRHFTAK